MSVINPNETSRSWRTHKRETAVHLYLAGAEGDGAALVGAKAAGFPLILNLVANTDWIDPEDVSTAVAAVIQVDVSTPASIKRFERLAASVQTPLIAAAYDPPLSLVRSLVRAGAHDVVPLPLELEDLETSLMPVRDAGDKSGHEARLAHGRLVSMVKSVGGIGATTLLTQTAIRAAEMESAAGREVCLIDFDLQFGNAAFQLGLRPTLSLADLFEAGNRVDGEFLRATTSTHKSGLKVIAAPPVLMPLDAVTSDQLIEIVNLAKQEFGTVFIDLPANWTNWSLSLLAQSDLILLATELSVTGLQRARRQLELVREQDLGAIELRIVANRFEKGLLKTIRPADVEKALGRPLSYTIANDPAVVRPATDRGIPIAEVKRKSAVGKDIDILEAGISAILGRER